MYTKLISWIFVIMVLFSSNACAAVVQPPEIEDGIIYAVQAGSTLWGMSRAIASAPGTMVMFKDSNVMLMWGLKDMGWAFVVINTNNGLSLSNFAEIGGLNGNLVNARTIADLASFLQERGWQAAGSVAEIPGYLMIKTALESSTSWLCRTASNMTTFVVLVVPMTATDIYDLLQLPDYVEVQG